MAKQSAGKIAAKDADQYMVRLPPGMRQALAKLAETNGRSMNMEIVAAIQDHLTRPDRLAVVEQFVERHKKLLDGLEEYHDWLVGGLASDFEKLEDRVNRIDERTSEP